MKHGYNFIGNLIVVVQTYQEYFHMFSIHIMEPHPWNIKGKYNSIPLNLKKYIISNTSLIHMLRSTSDNNIISIGKSLVAQVEVKIQEANGQYQHMENHLLHFIMDRRLTILLKHLLHLFVYVHNGINQARHIKMQRRTLASFLCLLVMI